VVNFELFCLLNGLLNRLLNRFCVVLSGFEWFQVGLCGLGRCVDVFGCVWVCLGVFLG
jgi:hypothetical protein